MDLNTSILAGSLVLLVGVAAVRVSTRIGLPSLLLYLVIGLVLGESGLGFGFEDAELTMILGTIALAMILAEGGFSTRWDVIRPVVGLSGLLATAGVAISVAITATIAYWALEVDVRTALLLGAVVGSTDAAATFAIMRRLPLAPRIRATLEAESGFNDPPVIILVSVVASDAWHQASGWQILGLVVFQLVGGVLIGVGVAFLGQRILASSALPAVGLYPLATLAIMFLAFAVAGLLGVSGLMAIYVAGMWLGNAKLPHRQATAGFADGLGWVAQIGLFVLLGLLASPTRLPDALLPAAIVGIGLTLVARPISVVACAIWWRVPWRHQMFLSWAGLRGAVPIVVATIPVSEGLPAAHRVFDIVFVLVITFVLIQAPLLPRLARWSGLMVERADELAVESAPLEKLGASVLQFEVPQGSRLHGVFVDDLRLSEHVVLAFVAREGGVVAAGPHLSLRHGDHLLLAVPDAVRDATEGRLQAISRGGRLAVWNSPLSSEPYPPSRSRPATVPTSRAAR
ncbi:MULTISPECIES: potassium/proton antiporter [Nocardioides]|uniref:potassium/proton antiporter n=1 Tax=Nocardioides TaxID=1839 RepID=UPI000330D944|nr:MULTISPECIES: potassium/proton antiporter [Nocardioides]EON23797.1 potassium/proton antiporter [Nocardioides sp. CF8]